MSAEELSGYDMIELPGISGVKYCNTLLNARINDSLIKKCNRF